MKKLIILSAACGVGKSTMAKYLNENHMLAGYVCIDTDEVGINWWDYAGTSREHQYSEDCLAQAVKMSGEQNLFFVSCMNPCDSDGVIRIPPSVSCVIWVGMICSDLAITERLKARPAERMCGSDEFIQGQINYNRWFLQNKDKFHFFIDNTDQSVHETAEKIATFVKSVRHC